ncbi:MAG: flagellin N-terminal helical domain-containing protein [Candidatus Fervidibacter sp.]|uniref:flagellin N-terminal helical domain-containing protein n=1 Tax=Candidatus Fervidibacter sp. TaxID=3100871 RepID=UPI00404A17C3
MGLRINTNVTALNVHRNLVATDFELSKVMEKLSSGLRINRAADDAAGLAVSEKLRTQVRGLQVATENSQHAISLVQVAEGALNEVHGILQRLRELAVQAANDHLTDSDRQQIQKEVNALLAQIDYIGSNTQFNTKKLLSGDFASTPLTFQVGANAGEIVGITIATVNIAAMGISDLSVATLGSASNAINSIDSAISFVTDLRAKLGAFQNRLERIVSNSLIGVENQSAAESRIRDVDMAKAVMDMVRYQILQNTGVAALAQANALPQAVLTLLR